jgi:hypothetical protein
MCREKTGREAKLRKGVLKEVMKHDETLNAKKSLHTWRRCEEPSYTFEFLHLLELVASWVYEHAIFLEEFSSWLNFLPT